MSFQSIYLHAIIQYELKTKPGRTIPVPEEAKARADSMIVDYRHGTLNYMIREEDKPFTQDKTTLNTIKAYRAGLLEEKVASDLLTLVVARKIAKKGGLPDILEKIEKTEARLLAFLDIPDMLDTSAQAYKSLLKCKKTDNY